LGFFCGGIRLAGHDRSIRPTPCSSAANAVPADQAAIRRRVGPVAGMGMAQRTIPTIRAAPDVALGVALPADHSPI